MIGDMIPYGIFNFLTVQSNIVFVYIFYLLLLVSASSLHYHLLLKDKN